MSDDEKIAKVRKELASQVTQLAAEAVEIAGEHGVVLDFTEASLESLDQYLAELAGWSLTDEQKENAAQILAAYLLEVGRRAHGGFYQWWETRDAPVLVAGSPDCRIGMLTIDKVRGRIGGNASDSIPFFYAGFAKRVRLRQPGDSATYV